VPDKTGKTRLQILHEIRSQTGVVAPQLRDLPDVPLEGAHVWRWFCDLGSARSSGMAINPISWNDMNAYFTLQRITPAQWELAAIRALDDAYLKSRDKGSAVVVKGAKGLNSMMTRKVK